MWILERASARDHDAPVRYPDSDTTGVAPRWAITLNADVQVWCDAEVASVEQVDGDAAATLARAPGDQVVVIGRAGSVEVADPTATWLRTLAPDDVLVLEGDDAGAYTVAPSPGGAWTALHVRSATTAPLRWIP